jgi:hypothetical protein
MYAIVNRIKLLFCGLLVEATEKVCGNVNIVDGMIYLQRDEVRRISCVMIHLLREGEYENGVAQQRIIEWWLTHTKYDALVFTEYGHVGVASLPGNKGCFTGTLTGIGF